MVALSYGFTRLREEDINWWNQVIREQGLRHLGRGVALGCVVYLAQVGVAATLGWVRFQTAGWEGSSKTAVVETAITHLGNLCVAWNEEMLYRGYGLQSLTQAIGLPGAVAIQVPLFAWGHAPGWRTFLGQSALGLSTTALQLYSRSVWVPVGYHAAWNYVQTAIIGPPDASPSIWPMHIQGPVLWMGRPGYPEPGLLSALMNLVVVAGALFAWQLRRRRSHH